MGRKRVKDAGVGFVGKKQGLSRQFGRGGEQKGAVKGGTHRSVRVLQDLGEFNRSEGHESPGEGVTLCEAGRGRGTGGLEITVVLGRKDRGKMWGGETAAPWLRGLRGGRNGGKADPRSRRGRGKEMRRGAGGESKAGPGGAITAVGCSRLEEKGRGVHVQVSKGETQARGGGDAVNGWIRGVEGWGWEVQKRKKKKVL